MRLIREFNEFMLDKKIDLLLEGNMIFSKDFKSMLSNIDSDIARSILNLSNVDVDVATNYISKSDKNDIINFIADNRIKSFGVENRGMVIDNRLDYKPVLEKIREASGTSLKEKLDVNIEGKLYLGNVSNGTEVNVLRSYTLDEFKSILSSVDIMDFFLSKYSVNPQDWVGNKLLLVEIDGGVSLEMLKKRDPEAKIVCLIREKGITFETLPNVGTKNATFNEFIKNGNRSQMKVGRFIRRLLTKADIKFTDADIEDFVNKYKSRFEIESDAFRNFEIVDGEDIRKYYHVREYSNPVGVLGQSCMRHGNCQPYLDIYVESPDCRLVILRDEENSEKILGRALLWHVKEFNGTPTSRDEPYIGYFMDRVYTSDEHGRQLFIDYAKENGWLYKANQNSDSGTKLLLNGKGADIQKIYSLSEYDDYDYWPYMDTMKYFCMEYYRDEDKSTISSQRRGPLRSLSYVTNDATARYDYELESTSGGNNIECETCGGEGYASCYDCSGSGTLECGQCDGSGEETCDDCGGSGKYESGNECDTCGGEGSMECDRCDAEGYVGCDSCYGEGYQTCHDCGGNG